jgi:hypothetical protein
MFPDYRKRVVQTYTIDRPDHLDRVQRIWWPRRGRNGACVIKVGEHLFPVGAGSDHLSARFGKGSHLLVVG